MPDKSRGALTNRTGRFESLAVEAVDDGWGIADEELPPVQTTVQPEPAHSVITKNNSPDIPFELSINPYRGCEHGCVYCVSGDTPILMGDGSEKPMAEIAVGDEIYGTAKAGFYRRFVRTRVLAHWRTKKPAWRVRLADGTQLVASGDPRYRGIVGLVTDLRLQRRRGNAAGDGMNLFVVGAIETAGRICWSVDEAVEALKALG